MRSYLLIKLFCIFSFSLSGQSWALIHPDNHNIFAFPDKFNGVRMRSVDKFSTKRFLQISADGSTKDTIAFPISPEWVLTNADRESSTYWTKNDVFNQTVAIQKLDANDNPEWTRSFVKPSNFYYWSNGGPNGSCVFALVDEVSNKLWLKIVDKNGLVYPFPEISITNRLIIGEDNSLVYDAELANQNYWYKRGSDGQILWSKEINGSAALIFSNGNTLFDGPSKFRCLDTIGNLVWEKDYENEFGGNPNDIRSYFQRKDGSVILIFEVYYPISEEYKFEMLSINSSDGSVNWHSKPDFLAYPGDDYSRNLIRTMEMQDGGILFGFEYKNNNANVTSGVIIRTRPNGEVIHARVTGKVFNDESFDCIDQTSEPSLAGFIVRAQSGSLDYTSVTNAQGEFDLRVKPGTYTVSVTNSGSYWESCPPKQMTLSTSDLDTTITFGAKALTLCPEMSVSVASNAFRRCFDDNVLQVSYFNLGTAQALNASIEIELDSKLQFISAIAPVASVIGQTYRFDLGNVDANQSGSFSITFKVDCNTAINELLCVESQVYPDTVCNSLAGKRNENRFCMPVVGSFDPNDKTAFTNGKPNTETILPNEPLEYMIRFQNTGNDTAFNIVIRDTLASTLNPRSVIPGASSHPYVFDLIEDRIIEFKFNQILLPDSFVNEPFSHGFVKFSILQQKDNSIGTRIENSAAIFFDFNDPIITNVSQLEVSLVSSATSIPMLNPQVYPVPAHDEVMIRFPEEWDGEVTWQLFDLTGKAIRFGTKSDLEMPLRLSRQQLLGGVYLCCFTTSDGAKSYAKVIFE